MRSFYGLTATLTAQAVTSSTSSAPMRLWSAVAFVLVWDPSPSLAQAGVNAWPPAEQQAAVRTPLSLDRLTRVERAIQALVALSKREPRYCGWVGGEESSIAAEVTALAAHKEIGSAIEKGPLTPREFIEMTFALVMAGMAVEAKRSGLTAPPPAPPAANMAFYAANQERVDRVLALDPC